MSGPRLAMFVHTLDDRAISRTTLLIAEELARRGAEMSVIAARRMPSARPAGGIRVVDLRMGPLPTMLAVPHLALALRPLHLDAVFAHGNGPGRALVVAARLLRSTTARVVVVEHTHYGSFYRRRRTLRRLTTGALYPLADAVCAVSPPVAEDLALRFPAARPIQILPAAVPISRWSGLRCDPTPAAPLIVSVANVVRRKGQDLLVRALPAIRDSVPGARLALVGRIDDEAFAASLRLDAARLGVADAVTFTGHQADPSAVVSRASVFALASRTEGLSVVLIEALAAGIPAVATDAPGGIRFVLGDGSAGLIVPVDDVPALAAAITRVLGDGALRARLVAAGRARAAYFGPADVADGYLRLARGERVEAWAPAA